MVALGGASGVALHRLFCRGAVHDRCLVVGIAHAGCGQLGQHASQLARASGVNHPLRRDMPSTC